jgi:hypothetical protein
MNPLAPLQRVVRFVQRRTGRGQSASERAEANAQASARKYWRRRVEEEQREDAPKERLSRKDAAARKSARSYWEREVADEKERRGTPDPPGKR